MTFFDFLKDLNDTAKERLKTPISGAFIFSFAIYNWRPIAQLFLSTNSIEDRIEIINVEYCNWSAIIVPIVMALIYTLIVPAIMIMIDWILVPIKKNRITRIYVSKEFLTEKKIKYASQEFKLKSVETGNKQIEEFQMKIKTLEESLKQMNNSYNNTISELNERLSQSNLLNVNYLEEVNFLKTNKESEESDSYIIKTIPKKIKEQFLRINYSRTDGEIDFSNHDVSESLIKYLIAYNLVKKHNEDGKFYITTKGVNLFHHLNMVNNL
ncbi:hypothetical protein MW871_14965 [Flavobacterium sp. I-SCBP12n]|uniref:Uncharacterized protein n=1 Tax=Flavobacterium pygoscelis TaxID=2893176 RepID=A0A9X1XU04_9FLAO|nr:hypothetical protein [Flavobacterium pygoscelis]MCK8143189.1 hypothetical protein [Flavobacterium pygoscelis]